MKFATAALVATATAATVTTTAVTKVCPTADKNSDANKTAAKKSAADWTTWIADDANNTAVSDAEGKLTACYVKEKKITADKADTDATLDKVLCLTESNAHTAALNTQFLFKCNVTQATVIRTAAAAAKQALAVKDATAANKDVKPTAAHAATCATADATQIAANKVSAKDAAAAWTTFSADAAKVTATKDAATALAACKTKFATSTDTDADLVKKSGLCVKDFNTWQKAANAEWTESCIIDEAKKIRTAAAKAAAKTKNNSVTKAVTAAHPAKCPVKPPPVVETTEEKKEAEKIENEMTPAEKETAEKKKKAAAKAKETLIANAKSHLANTLAKRNSCYGTAKATTADLKTKANKDTCNEEFNAWQAAANESWEIGCESSDTGMIIGIICGVVGIIVIAGIAYKCHSDKKKDGDTFADDLYMSFIDNETA